MNPSTQGPAARAALTLAWTSVGLAAVCGGAELLAGLGHRWGWWHFRTGLQIMRWGATVDLGAVFIGLVATALAWKFAGRRTRGTAGIGLALALAVGAPPLYLLREVSTLPRIHDISTDTGDPPRFVALLALRKGAENPVDYAPEVAIQQKQAYPDIVPLMLAMPPQQARARAERTARALGWDVVAAAPGDLRIEATDTTLLFGFKDDIVIRIRPEGAGSRIDLRSLSRVGRSDFGANAKRIRTFTRRLAQEA